MFNIILPVPAVQSLSLGGGGARGAVYGPALGCLEKEGILSTVKDVQGVSAGAITACLVALGATTLELQALAQQTDFKSLLVEWSLFKDGLGVFYTTKLKVMIEENVQKCFLTRLHEARSLCNEQYDATSPEGLALLSQLTQLEAKQTTITFDTLNQLRQVFTTLGQPNKVKTISILAVCMTDGRPFLFSYKNHKNTCISDAATASCAIPPVFKPHYIDINGKKEPFIDGGFYRSIFTPTHQIPAFKTEMEKRLNSILLLLQPDTEANEHMYGPPQSLNFFLIFIGYLCKLIFGADGIQGRFEMEKSLKEYGHNVVSMNVDINPNDLGVTLEQKIAAGEKTEQSIKTYFSFRKEAGYAIQGSFSSCLYQVPFGQLNIAQAELCKQLSDAEPQIQDELDASAKKIIVHRVKQETLAILINEKIDTIQQLIEAKTSVEDVDTALLLLNEMMTTYCTLPLGVEDDDKTIENVNMERLLNGTSYQLENLFTSMAANQYSMAKGVMCVELYERLHDGSEPVKYSQARLPIH